MLKLPQSYSHSVIRATQEACDQVADYRKQKNIFKKVIAHEGRSELSFKQATFVKENLVFSFFHLFGFKTKYQKQDYVNHYLNLANFAKKQYPEGEEEGLLKSVSKTVFHDFLTMYKLPRLQELNAVGPKFLGLSTQNTPNHHVDFNNHVDCGSSCCMGGNQAISNNVEPTFDYLDVSTGPNSPLDIEEDTLIVLEESQGQPNLDGDPSAIQEEQISNNQIEQEEEKEVEWNSQYHPANDPSQESQLNMVSEGIKNVEGFDWKSGQFNTIDKDMQMLADSSFYLSDFSQNSWWK